MLMRRLLAISLVVGFSTGCDSLINLFAPQAETGSAELKRFSSEQELAKYLSDQIAQRNQNIEVPSAFRGEVAVDAVSTGGEAGSDGAAPTPAAPGEGAVSVNNQAADGSFSTTTIQEVGVDESDVVKTDGTNFYLISDNRLRIIRATPPETMAELASLPLEGFGQELYLLDGRVVALTQSFGQFFALETSVVSVSDPVGVSDSGSATTVSAADMPPTTGDAPGPAIAPDPLPPPQFERPKSFVTVIDITDPAAPQVLSQTAFDGSMSSSRLIDGTLQLVVSNFQRFYIDVFPALGRPEFNATAEATIMQPALVLPQFEQTIGDAQPTNGPLLTWRELYRPTDPDGFGVVTVVSMDVAGDSSFNAVGVIAEPGLIYSSRKAMYLTDTNYDFSGAQRETTDIYKFTYGDGAATPTAVGTVKGRILNQYSMGEYRDNLRVASTLSQRFGFAGPITLSSSGVYVLSETDGTLATVGQIEGIAPGETIQSARFLGDRGYLVTFRQIDPFFTLDLADPANPRMLGELKVPGFSTFIVPLDEDHLLTVGQSVPEEGLFGPLGVQLSIFDVSDFANPVLSHQAVIGDQTGASSEALFNPKAFTYFAQQNLVALPISIFGGPTFLEGPVPAVGVGVAGDATAGSAGVGTAQVAPEPPINPAFPVVDQGFEGLAVYRVTIEGGFESLGRLSTRFKEEGFFYSSYTRGVFIGGNVFAVTDRGIHGSDLADLTSVEYELFLPPENNLPDVIGSPTERPLPPVEVSITGQ